jgi:hypothetical protein
LELAAEAGKSREQGRIERIDIQQDVWGRSDLVIVTGPRRAATSRTETDLEV